MTKQRKSGALALAVATVALGHVAKADISGFSGFAPVNTTGSVTTINYNSSTFTLTDGGASEATAGFNSTPQSIGSFLTTFTYTVPGGNGTTNQFAQGDGFTFIIQDDSRTTAAVGGTGGDKGYRGTSTGSTAISNSVALGYEMYNGQTFGVARNGSTFATTSTTGQSVNLGSSIANGHPIQFTIGYNGNTLSTGIYDTVSKASYYFTNPNINIAATVGAPTAYVGFGGGTGGAAASQNITNFSFTSTATAPQIFSPLSLTPSSFNQDMVIEAGAPAIGAASSITASMDQGLAKGGATYYEKGYNAANASTGLPASGSTFTSQADSRHSFTMQSYTGNNALLLGTNSSTGTISLVTPSTLSAVSFLTAVGNGIAAFDVTVNYADGAPSTLIPYSAVSPDWFFQGPPAYVAMGRAYASTGTATTFDNVGNNEPNLYQVDLMLPNTVDPISSFTIHFDGSATNGGNLAIFAVSGAPVPEPTTLGLVGLASFALLGRARRNVA